MNRARHTAFIALLVAATLVVSQAPAVGAPEVAAASGPSRVIVGWRDRASAGEAERSLAARGLSLGTRLYGGRRGLVDVPEGESAEALAVRLARLPGVEYAEPDYPVSIAWTPNDPYFIASPPATYQWGPRRIGAEAAWDVARGAGVTVAIVDTGVDLDHPDLAAKLVPGYDFVNGDAVPQDDHGHGTHCAGIAAAVTDNGIGVAGIAPAAVIMPVKTLDSSGNGSLSTLAAGLDWAVDHGADVVSMSLGGSSGSVTMAKAMARARAAGVVVVAASGNANASVFYPAAYPEAIAVGATDASDVRATYSNKGPELDVMAPGGTSASGIVSAVIDGYGTKNGTSMATPHVAGAAALLLSAHPTATPDAIAAALQASASDLGPAGFDNLNGFGLVRLDGALSYLASEDITAPVVSSDAQALYENTATIRLSASDGAWNVRRVGLSLDGGPTAFDWEVTESRPGTHTLTFSAEDFAGNRSATETVVFEIVDTLPPVTTSNAKLSYPDGVARITLSASDGTGTGVTETYWSLDGSTAATGTLVATSAPGTHVLSFASVDLVGNRETTRTATFRVYGRPDVARVAGSDRYGTAIALSRATFAAGSVPAAVVASGETFPDALAASGLAGALGCPVLLTPRSRVPDALFAELGRLGATRVLIVGGTAAVGHEVEAAFGRQGFAVERIAGRDRYATSAAVAARAVRETGRAPDGVFVARGEDFPDALAVSPLAYSAGYPVLLAHRDALAPETAAALSALAPGEVVIAGGVTALAAGVEAQARAVAGAPVTRVAGANRYDTAARIAAFGLDEGLVPGSYIGVATGLGFADALSGGAVAGTNGGVLVLTRPGSLPAETREFVAEYGRAMAPVRIFGGIASVRDEVRATLAAIPVL